MFRRIVAGVLWAFFGWYLVAHFASLAALPIGIAPIGALAMAAVAFIDWATLVRRATAGRSGQAIREPQLPTR